MSEVIATHAMVFLKVADDGLDGGPPFELALDLRRDAALLAGGVNLELVVGRGVVAAIAGIGNELAAGGMLHGGGDAHLDAELVGPVRLALADALDLRRVQGIDLAAALAALLFQHAPGQEQRSHERLPQNLIPDDVPLDVADDAAKIGLELA